MPRIEISNAVRADHDEVRTIIGDAFAQTAQGVEIHVKARRPSISWRAVCGLDNCAPNNWQEAPFSGHWVRRKRDIEALIARGRHGPVQRVVTPAGFSGRAYHGVPRIANTQPDARYLVTLHMPGDPRSQAGEYPAIRRYPGLKTAPEIAVQCWREELFALAAHEACHIEQFETGGRVSEIDAERAAVTALRRWRTPEQLVISGSGI